ncbi:hypothetical protein FHS78_001823 [Parvibaculum indicum]|uniref:DUF1365 domain-containing protein n=1 Tax=Parvibaculum indicum TaxID=562969 RepID=UPI0031B6186D|nr:hypothetical protein [Parvibaculum indicum]
MTGKTAGIWRSRLYAGSVFHRRLRPRRHELRYGVFYMLLDLDELDGLDRGLAGFAHNRFAPVSFHDRDHGGGDGRPLRQWIENQLQRAGLTVRGGRVELLTMPRIFGYAFNPLSIWFCRDGSDRLIAVLYEVRNTFGDRHCYLFPVAPGDTHIDQRCDKAFYVSPFMAVEGEYRFRLMEPGARFSLTIRESDGEGTLLTASFAGEAKSLSASGLAGMLLRYPLLTLKVVAGIHWEALKLLAKGLRFRSRPAPPASPVTVIAPGFRR